MALKPPKVETGILGFEYFASGYRENCPLLHPRYYTSIRLYKTWKNLPGTSPGSTTIPAVERAISS